MNALHAASIQELLPQLDDEWYKSVVGSYSDVPTWGPETSAVSNLIGRSGPHGDIVSWDTRAANVAQHLYLIREWNPSGQSTPNNPHAHSHVFSLRSHAELLADGWEL